MTLLLAGYAICWEGWLILVKTNPQQMCIVTTHTHTHTHPKMDYVDYVVGAVIHIDPLRRWQSGRWSPIART